MSDILSILRDFSDTYDSLVNDFVKELNSNLLKGNTINKSVDDSFLSTDFINSLQSSLLDSVVACSLLEGGVADEDKLREALLMTAWVGKLSLQDRLDNISNSIKQQMKDTINSNYLLLSSLKNTLSTELKPVELYAIERMLEGLRKYLSNSDMNDLISNVKLMRTDKITYERVKDSKNLIATLLLPLVGGISGEILTNTYKSKYVGLNNTEGARANYEGLLRNTKNKANVFGYRWELSPYHNRFPFDICDVNANVDVGFGKGIYPKDKIPTYPAHMHCMCAITEVKTKDVDKNSKFNDGGINKYIKGLTANEKNDLFTQSNLDKYNKTKDYTLMNSYSGFENPKART